VAVPNGTSFIEYGKNSLLKLTQTSRVVMQYITAHCDIPENDKADRLAKDASQQQQENPCISNNEAKMLLKQAHRKTWQQKKTTECNTILQLNRREATTIFRLQTGHCRPRAHPRRMNLCDAKC
jgi:hypothetical protein